MTVKPESDIFTGQPPVRGKVNFIFAAISWIILLATASLCVTCMYFSFSSLLGFMRGVGYPGLYFLLFIGNALTSGAAILIGIRGLVRRKYGTAIFVPVFAIFLYYLSFSLTA